MTDRELLELAAKAAGWIATNGLGECWDIDNGVDWNPLTDDGDALRLAVKISFVNGVGLAMFFADELDPTVVVRKQSDNSTGAMELVGDDPCAATRRAIVRAAAAIGETLP